MSCEPYGFSGWVSRILSPIGISVDFVLICKNVVFSCVVCCLHPNLLNLADNMSVRKSEQTMLSQGKMPFQCPGDVFHSVIFFCKFTKYYTL